MPEHIVPYDNFNRPIIDTGHTLVPRCYLNVVKLAKGKTFTYRLKEYESVCVGASGTFDIAVGGETFNNVGVRKHLFAGKPDSVYIPLDSEAVLTGVSEKAVIFIAGGRHEKKGKPFRITPEDVDKVQYGSDDTKTHRKIFHVLGQKTRDLTGRLLVSELFTVGAGGWSGFPPHKHDEDIEGIESAFEEVYYFAFNPENGFGAQFAYVHEDDLGPVHHIKYGSTILLERGYHPVCVAPGYEMYYFTILVGKTQKALKQNFEKAHEYQVHTIPGIKDMVSKFK
ncbi:MAG: 5-deoxy-glucuronate isomerase [Bacteroidetes bacterium]|nr:5-deoxy-glucuronate isomerase [Bacteroidota bacterium]